MITIDGSQGEGGGQIVRSSLALSMVTGTPVTIANVRAGRKKPGLRRQHLTAVRAARQICDATVTGDVEGSLSLDFEPGHVAGGDYRFDVGTAGSATLVLQTVLPALMIAEQPSNVELHGGTHNPMAPPYDFLARAYLPLLTKIGPRVEPSLQRHGFYPAGGGSFTVRIRPTREFKSLNLLERGKLKHRRVEAIVANLPTHIGERECKTIARKTGWPKGCFQTKSVDSNGPGNLVMIELEHNQVTELITSFGERGKKAERVASEAARAALQYLDTDVPVGEHLADQLLLPLAIAAHFGTPGSFLTTQFSDHSTTHIDIIARFLDVHIEVTENAVDERQVRVLPDKARQPSR